MIQGTLPTGKLISMVQPHFGSRLKRNVNTHHAKTLFFLLLFISEIGNLINLGMIKSGISQLF